MGTESSSKEKSELEQARELVPTDEIVVNWATVQCSCCQGDTVYLKIEDTTHGIRRDKSISAHDGNCTPEKNIGAFTYCEALGYEESMKELKDASSGEKEELYNTAYQDAISKNPRNGPAKYRCVLPLLERWFESDEKMTVKSMLEFSKNHKFDITYLKTSADVIMETIEETAYNACSYYETYSDPKEAQKMQKEREQQYNDIVNNRAKIKANLEELKQLDTTIETEKEDFAEIRSSVDNAMILVAEVIKLYDSSYNYLISKEARTKNDKKKEEEFRTDLVQYKNDISALQKKIKDWEEESFHIITMKSFLVCRCGGILEFKTSGQEYSDKIFKLIGRIQETVSTFQGYCQSGTSGVSKYGDGDNVHDSYKRAAAGMAALSHMLSYPNDAISDPQDVSIVIRLTSQSYIDEATKRLWETIGLCCLPLKNLLLNFIVTAIDIAASIPDVVAVTSKSISFVDTVQKISGTPTINEKLLFGNDILGALLSATSFSYRSTNEWVRYIRLYAFAGDYAHIYQVELNEDYEFTGYNFSVPEVYDANEYYAEGVGMGVKWGERLVDGKEVEDKPPEGVNVQEDKHVDDVTTTTGDSVLWGDIPE